MLPEDFVDYSKKFEVGFLASVNGSKPNIDIVDFEVSKDSIKITGENLPEGGVCLVFANEWFSEKSEMAQVQGVLAKKLEGDGYELAPNKIFWTFSFDVEEYPEKIVRRWNRR
ncbi:MAG: hypothetical protein V3T58_07050 [Candidatus Hydrothermarchaeales archaeon]